MAPSRTTAFVVILIAVIAAAGIVIAQTTMREQASAPTHDELLASLMPLTITTDDESIELFVEVADTGPERAQGLQGRRQLARQSGMLFVFDATSTKHFWMKNTLIPLDILWIDATKTVVGHDTMIPCRTPTESNPCPVTASPDTTRYALEVHDQFIEETNITPGDTVSFTLPQ